MQPEGLKILATLALVLTVFVGSVSGYMAYLRRVAPAPTGFDLTTIGDAGSQRFRKLDSWANLTALKLMLFFGAAIYCALAALAALRAAALPPAELTFTVDRTFFALIAAFSGFGLAVAVSLPWMKRARREDAQWYATYVAVRRYHCDYQRLSRDFGVGFVIVSMLVLPFGLNNYVQIRPASFAFHGFFSFHEQDFPYTDITRIETAPKFVAPNGRVRYDRDYVVHFKDGSKWVARSIPSGTLRDPQRVTELLSAKSGVPIIELPIFSTHDLYDWL